MAKPRTKAAAWLLRASIAVVGLSVVFVAWLFLIYPRGRPSRSERSRHEYALVIEADDSIEDIAARLEAEHFVRSSLVFRIYARLLGAQRSLRRGTILLRDDMDIRTMFLRIADGYGPAFVPVSIPEGFDRYQIGERLERWGITTQAEFIVATEDPELLRLKEITGPSAEGYLFPDTYILPEGTDAQRVVSLMVSTFWLRAGDVVRNAPVLSAEGPIASVHDVVALASIVEEEAVHRDEQPIIAGVFLNRLRDENFLPLHRLQADPTVSYGCKVQPALLSCSGFDGRHITRAMLEGSDNIFNTYRHAGLPPTAVTNPGLAALRAAASPASHQYFFFVARGGGRHAFSETLERHNRGVSALRERERAAGQ